MMLLLIQYIIQRIQLYMINNALLHKINDTKKVLRKQSKQHKRYENQLSHVKQDALTKEQEMIQINELLLEVAFLYSKCEATTKSQEKERVMEEIDQMNNLIIHLCKQARRKDG